MTSADRATSFPRQLAIIAAFNTAIALGIAFARSGGFLVSLVYSQCIGLSIFLLIHAAERLLARRGVARTRRGMILVSAAGTVAGFLAGSALARTLVGPVSHGGGGLAIGIAITLFASATAAWYFMSREQMAQMRLQAQEIERGAIEARLKLLQAQIEPHFLFNTLANLHTLIGADPARAQKMLESLNDYLRATLDAARRDSGTLGEEFALLRGYLEVLAIRMGPRLAFSLSLPEALSGASLPPMLLQPLVENAVKHGLEPKIDGGRVDVSASRNGEELILKVEDTGLGNDSTKGAGVGVQHVTDRLAAVYGASASLRLEKNSSGGITATIRIAQ